MTPLRRCCHDRTRAGDATATTAAYRDAIVSSLRAGVVPQRGFAHIQVGRANEVAAIGHDLDRVADGGSMVRFVIGDYGSGKTFFLHLAPSIAREELVTLQPT